MDTSTRIFEEHRRLLEGLAYRMLGTLADAKDVVQETYLRWSSISTETIQNPKAWLTTVCSRIALDTMKSARAQRETYYGTWLPEPYIDEDVTDPGEYAAIDDSVSVALMVILEKLSPAERATFILHEVFAHSFGEISEILGKTEPSCRKLASRARGRIQSEHSRFQASKAEHDRLLKAFVEAATSGNFANLNSILLNGVELYSDGGGKAQAVKDILVGSEKVTRFFAGVWRNCSERLIEFAPHYYNGTPGLLIYQEGALVTAISISIEDGAISRIYAIRNPDKLAAFGH